MYGANLYVPVGENKFRTGLTEPGRDRRPSAVSKLVFTLELAWAAFPWVPDV